MHLKSLDGENSHKKTSEYDQELPQSQTTDQTMEPREKDTRIGTKRYTHNTNKIICAFGKGQGSNLALAYLKNVIEFYKM